MKLQRTEDFEEFFNSLEGRENLELREQNVKPWTVEVSERRDEDDG